MRQHPSAHDEPAGGDHDEPDDHINGFVQALEGEPMREAEMGEFTRQRLLCGKGERKDQPGHEAAPRRIAADRVAEGDRPGVFIRGDAVHEPEQEGRHEIDRQADVARLPQVDGADHGAASLFSSAARQSRQSPLRITW